MDVRELIDQYYDGTISDSDASTLEQALRSDADARREFVAQGKRVQQLHAALGSGGKSIAERLAAGLSRNDEAPHLQLVDPGTGDGSCPCINITPLFSRVAKIVMAAAAVVAIGIFLTVNNSENTGSNHSLSGTAVQTPNYQEETLDGIVQIAASVSDTAGANTPLVTIRLMGDAVPYRTEPAEKAVTLFLKKEAVFAKTGGVEMWEQFTRRLQQSMRKLGLDVVTAEQGDDLALTILWPQGKARFSVE